MADPRIVLVPGNALWEQTWWAALHLTINAAFQNKDHSAFPPTWTRLPQDPDIAAERLAGELGSEGVLAVALLENNPVACAGVVPFRGPNWIDDANAASGSNEGASAPNVPAEQHVRNEDPTSSVVEDWELCCVCVHPIHRRAGLSTLVIKAIEDLVKQRGAVRLNTMYSTAETGDYWLRIGFKTVPGAGGVLEKGFTVESGLPGLLADIHFTMGCKNLTP
ncbi:hypothetical protein CKM354_000535400 [Cercospora kikuchii]|uniref:N-acetyltransferase domain-containing protein n=1 Tax=Cercospora kikuchii TaxID=84275 RepID=A0A9P3FGQ3_9PEZI|nr:uncharacterized protein CKM354_000535400 [Cercospora kikuchii]GIZ42074.1 hypothetical protein CKM354_000535400 [Cercospora kikuchii]